MKLVSSARLGGSGGLILLLLLGIADNGLARENVDDRAKGELAELLDISFTELANITLTTASRTEKRLFDTPAAVYVIDQEEIRRSGMDSVPELLRLVPGLQVAQINNDIWVITSRGFNAQYSNKLLILMDGRTLYNPLFAGVHWNVQDIMLDNVERIEVIRGPGGSLWGANAVNGVINIITKKAANTQGGRLSVSAGNIDKAKGEIRYGGKAGEKVDWRVYVKGFDKDSFTLTSGSDAGDSWSSYRSGFRADFTLSAKDFLTLQGDLFHVDLDSITSTSSGGNLQLRWDRTISESSDLSLQLYYDNFLRANNEKRDTYDIDFQHRFSPWQKHELIWGLGYRMSKDKMTDSNIVSWTPSETADETYSMFIQDEISLLDNRLHLTVGTKVENNQYSGWEYQPNARILYQINPTQALWASVSRAVRIPSRVDHDFNISVGGGLVLTITGSDSVKSEDLLAYEIGYRSQIGSEASIDIAAFYNKYDNLVSYEDSFPGFPGPIKATVFANKAYATTYGIETAVDWHPEKFWRLRASHTWLKMNVAVTADSTDTLILASDGDVPRNQLQLHSYLDLRDDLELDASMFYVDNITNSNIPAYLRLDLRLGWTPIKNLNVSISGFNLLDSQHVEFSGSTSGTTTSQVPRSIVARLDWDF